MKIIFFEVEDWEREAIHNIFPDAVLTDEKLTAENVSQFQDAEIISVFIYSALSSQVLEKMPNLKFVTTRSMGFDHIDMDYCKSRNLPVSNVPNYGAHTVAEHTLALMLALSRKIVESVERAKKGDFESVGLTGFDLFGKTLGVIGTGHIGANVAEYGLALGMKVIAYNHHEDTGLVEKGVKYIPLEQLLQEADIVSLHLPSTAETQHIINMNNIKMFKKGALLINTARGALIETAAILYGLEQGILQGVGLDVLEEESELKEERQLLSRHFLQNADYKTELMDHILMQRDDVIITPHNAFNSKEALQEILETTFANIKSFINNTPNNLIGQ